MEEASRDLEGGAPVRPCLVALAGEQRLFLAFLRAFAPRRHLDALVELFALAAPLDADRLVLSMGARAWSLDDPIPPVLPDGGDLRQRVLALLEVDGSAGWPRARSTVVPFDLQDGRVRWGEEISQEGEQAPLLRAMALTLRHRARIGRGATEEQIRAQAERCAARGHLLGLSPSVHRRLMAQPGRCEPVGDDQAPT